ncbi:VWA domain-containing protein [Roseateles violae]|uniref:VWA domain-containing protein n=1 Tax=Roseateles violae TaxID=3058042 RepID=A0ABT8DZ16_9BURK|nr:VWA domain-containing protein [Pelomonas sp. PFR6]MDN3922820.1 VWA domain-containing protein [Pelomonas sp. PFR6]
MPKRSYPTMGRAPLPAALLAGLLLSACGGGGGGNPAPPTPGVVKLTVKDSFGAPVPGVTVQGPQGQQVRTDAQGTALVPLDSPTASATLSLSRDSFVPGSVTVSGSASEVKETAVTLERSTAPAGGSLATRSGAAPGVDAAGQQMSFEIELLVVDGKSQPITNLTAADFSLRACSPLASTEGHDCVDGPGSSPDTGYTPLTAQPQALALIAGAPLTPFATALLLDQSGSIADTDPTGARLYSTKAFVQGLGSGDQALLAAFAGMPGAAIPSSPLSVYGPFRDRASASSAYFPILDGLAMQLGGNTPLYDSIDGLRQQIATTLPAPAGLPKAIVIFTDGADTSCNGAEACRLARERTIAAARQEGTRLFTIGLSKRVDPVALAELANGTGGAFLYADNTQQLLPLYGSVGNLVSLGQPVYRLRWTINAETAGSLRSGAALLGQVQVKAGQSSFDIPFVVGIP